MSWIYIALLVCAVAVLIAAEWPRLAERVGLPTRPRRRQRRTNLKLVPRTESEEFVASVQRDLERLPTTKERDRRR